jgi:hypothetical protein
VREAEGGWTTTGGLTLNADWPPTRPHRLSLEGAAKAAQASEQRLKAGLLATSKRVRETRFRANLQVLRWTYQANGIRCLDEQMGFVANVSRFR